MDWILQSELSVIFAQFFVPLCAIFVPWRIWRALAIGSENLLTFFGRGSPTGLDHVEANGPREPVGLPDAPLDAFG